MTADATSRNSSGRLDSFFEISARRSTVAAEVRGGVVTFIAMAYIVVLNPIILSDAQDVDGNSLDFAQVSATTSLAAGVMTVLFGLVARLPFAFAAGLGINSFLATTVVGSLTWPEAMGLVVINGIIIVILAATGLRTLIFDAVPMQLKLAITAGIGAFILFIGLVDAGFIGSTGVPSPPVGLGTDGTGSINSVPTLVFVFTLLLTGILAVRQVRGGIFIGLVAGTLVAVVIEAIWHLGSAAEHPGGWSLSVPRVDRLAVRHARPLPGRCVQPRQLRPHRRAGRRHAGVHVGVRELLRRDGHLHRTVARSRCGRRSRNFPATALGADRRGHRCSRRRGDVVVVQHRLPRVGGRHRGGCAHRLGEPDHGLAVLRRDVRHAARVDRAYRGGRGGAGHRRRDDVLAPSRRRSLGVLRRAARSC